MEFRLLGPVEVRAGGQPVGLGRPQQRLLLAALAVDAGRPVAIQTLACRLWDDAPAGRRRSLYVLVSRLRRVLKQASTSTEAVAVVRRCGGYSLEVDPQQIDLMRYQHLVTQAYLPGARKSDQVRLLRSALNLWRGDPLAGLPGQWAARTGQSLGRRHLDVVVTWARAELLAGEPALAVGPLTDLAYEHPLTEPLTEILMLALAATGRTAEALTRYTTIRQRLAHELGADPGPALQAAQLRVLQG